MAVGAAIGSAVVGVGGLVQGKKAGDAADDKYNKASSQLEKYMAQANVFGEDALEFSQGLLTDWEETFGSMQDNLSDYYSGLDPVKYATEYKSNLNDNIDKQLSQMNDTLSASGLQNSGMAAQTAKEAAFAKATGGAVADLAADDKVAAMQQGFVNSGANQQARAESGVAGGYSNLINIATGAGRNLANLTTGQAQQSAADAGGFMKGGLNTLSSGAGNFAG